MRELTLAYRGGRQARVIVAEGPEGSLAEEGTIREIEEDLDKAGRLRSYELVVSVRGFKEGVIVSLPAPISPTT